MALTASKTVLGLSRGGMFSGLGDSLAERLGSLSNNRKSDMNKPTCGPMYKEALNRYASGEPSKVHLFAAGFVSGQAEKVYLGACRAAMFRPSQDRQGMILEIVDDVCQRYGLSAVSPVGSQEEIWICRPKYERIIREELQSMEENSPAWHRLRAWLCGVPDDEIDEQFHLRAGHGNSCD